MFHAVSLLLLLWGMVLLWHAVQLANQEFFHFFHPSTTYLFENRDALLKSLIFSAVMGLIICSVSLILFDLAIHNLRTKVSWVLAVMRCVSAKAAPFALAFLCLTLIVLPTWILLDACFQPAMTWARVDLGIPDEIGQGYITLNSISETFIDSGRSTFFERSHAMSALGPRIGAMIFLLCGTVVSILLSLMHSVLNGASKKYVCVLTVALLGIAVLIQQQDHLLWFGIQQRVAKNLAPFQRVVQGLNREWPTKSGRLLGVGKYFAHEQRPGELYFRNSSSYGVAESLGGTVRKLPDEGVSFTLKPHYLFQLEYHPPKRAPLKTLHDKSGSAQLVRSTEIEEGWYLTKYEPVRR